MKVPPPVAFRGASNRKSHTHCLWGVSTLPVCTSRLQERGAPGDRGSAMPSCTGREISQPPPPTWCWPKFPLHSLKWYRHTWLKGLSYARSGHGPTMGPWGCWRCRMDRLGFADDSSCPCPTSPALNAYTWAVFCSLVHQPESPTDPPSLSLKRAPTHPLRLRTWVSCLGKTLKEFAVTDLGKRFSPNVLCACITEFIPPSVRHGSPCNAVVTWEQLQHFCPPCFSCNGEAPFVRQLSWISLNFRCVLGWTQGWLHLGHLCGTFRSFESAQCNSSHGSALAEIQAHYLTLCHEVAGHWYSHQSQEYLIYRCFPCLEIIRCCCLKVGKQPTTGFSSFHI